MFPIRLYVPNGSFGSHDLTLLRLFGCSRHLLSFPLHRSTILLMKFCVGHKFDIICCTHDKCQKCNYTHLGTTISFLFLVQSFNVPIVFTDGICVYFFLIVLDNLIPIDQNKIIDYLNIDIR